MEVTNSLELEGEDYGCEVEEDAYLEITLFMRRETKEMHWNWVISGIWTNQNCFCLEFEMQKLCARYNRVTPAQTTHPLFLACLIKKGLEMPNELVNEICKCCLPLFSGFEVD